MSCISTIFRVSSYVIFIIVLTACGGGGGGGGGASPSPAPGPAPAPGAVLQSISVTPTGLVLKVGASQQMSAIGSYDDGGQLDISGSVTWASVGVVSMNSSGLVTAVSPGSGIATAINASPAMQGFTFVYASTYGIEGSIGSPVTLTLETSHSGEVNFGGPGAGNGYSYYAVNVTPGAAYYISLSGLDGNAHLEIYDDSGFSNEVCASQNFNNDDERCYADGPAGGVLYIAVNGDDTNLDTAQGAAYTLTVNAGYKDEGSSVSPIALSLDTPVSGQVGSYLIFYMGGGSIYSAPVALTGRYTVSLTNITNNVSLMVLDGPGSGTILCESSVAGTGDESCSFQADRTPAYVLVSGISNSIGAGFTLTVTEDHAAYTEEGTEGAPVALTILPHHGHVGGINGYTNSYYSIPVTAMQSVRIQATGVDGDLGMYVYDGDSTFTTYTCSDFTLSAGDLVCLLEPATTATVYVKMTSNAGLGAEFSLNVTPINYAAEGTSVTPQTIVSTPVFDAPYSGTVDSAGSYYQVPVVAGKLHSVGLSSLSGDASLTVYDDSSLVTMLCTSDNANLADESCQATPTGSSVWVFVGGSTYGSKFDLTVDRVYVQQGSFASSFDITGLLPNYTTGEVGSGSVSTERTYLVATLTAGKAYSFQVTNNTDASLSAWVYDNAMFSSPLGCQLESFNNFSCTIEPIYSGTASIMVTSDDPYGSAFDLSITEVAYSTQGSVGTPVNIGAFPVTEFVGVSRLEHTGGTVDATNSYYIADVSGGYDYVNYVIGLTNQSADVDLYVYDDSSFTNLLCSSVSAGTSDEACAGLSPVGNNLYIKVGGASSGFGGTFNLTVDHDYAVEGAVSTGNGGNLTINSIALTQGVAYEGQAKGIEYSYYYLNPVASGNHTVTVSNMFDSTCVAVYDEADGKFNSPSYVYSGTNKALTPDKSFTYSFTAGVFVIVDGCGSSVTGTAFTITIN